MSYTIDKIKANASAAFAKKYGVCIDGGMPQTATGLEALCHRVYNKGWADCREKMLNKRWISCSERLPENEQEVEITYVKKHWKTSEPLYLTCRAFYSDGTVNTEESNYVWDETDNWEYIEKMDAYIIPEGWWECVSFAEEFAAVDMPVIAWMPLPEPYELKGEVDETD